MWYSKDDVLNDLAECTGVAINDVDDDYVVRGSQPPPLRKQNGNDGLDDEFLLRFGGYGDQLASNNTDNVGPDLNGISEMLRLVDTFDNPQNTYRPPSNGVVSPRHRRNKKEAIVISKPQKMHLSPTSKCPPKPKETEIFTKSQLNPNVKEFVPRVSQTQIINVPNPNNATSDNVNEHSNEIIENGTAVATNLVNDAVPKILLTERALLDNVDVKSGEIIQNNTAVASNVINNEENKQLPDKNYNSNISDEQSEKQKIIALLKSKISTASKQNALEKNVAIATLLRLHSRPAITPTNTTSSNSKCPSATTNSQQEPSESPKINSPPMVLLTPDYYAGPRYSPTILNVNDSEHNIPEPKPPLKIPLKTPSPRELLDPQIKESVDKVNNWFNSPEKKAKVKTPAPHIVGTVTFKKKESINSQSPCSEINRKVESLDIIPSFVPSQYAVDLARDLEARVKAKQEEKTTQPPLDIWTKLENDLKARDEMIKNRMNRSE